MGQASFDLAQRGIGVLVLGPGPLARARRYARLIRAPFPVLADPAREAFRAYGLRRRALRIQMSGAGLVDRDGALVYMRRATNPLFALDLDELLREIAGL